MIWLFRVRVGVEAMFDFPDAQGSSSDKCTWHVICQHNGGSQGLKLNQYLIFVGLVSPVSSCSFGSDQLCYPSFAWIYLTRRLSTKNLRDLKTEN
jgi:hypothetical protein